MLNSKIVGREVISLTPNLCRQALATLGSCIVGICAGLTFGVTAVMLPQLREDEELQYDGSADSWIASAASLSMIIGSLSAGTVLDIFGRRVAHIITGIPFIIGWTCITVANSSTLIIIGRLLTGLSSGAHKPIIFVYIGEIADPKHRTLALFLPGLMIHIGVLFSHVVGSYFSWRITAMICIVPNVISSICFMFLRESPLWLISKGRTEEGVETFRWFRGTGEAAEAELKAVLQSQKNKTSVKDAMDAICSITFFKPFLIMVLVVANMQLSGVNVMNFYALDIFQRTFSGKVDPFSMMIVTDIVRGSAAIVVCLLVKYAPKKIAFLTCSFGIAIFLYIVFAFMVLGRVWHVWVPVTCLILYIGLSGALITIGWTFLPEVMPKKVRGFGSGLVSATAYLLLFTVIKISPDIMNNFGEASMFASFATFSLIIGLFLCFLLPDTSGKTLQAIEDNFTKNNKVTEQTAL